MERVPERTLEEINHSSQTSVNESNYNPGLKLPSRPKAQESLRKKRNIKPPSPKDITPIIVNGNTVSREDITPIMDDTIIIRDNSKIDLLENPEAIHDLLEQHPKVLNEIPQDISEISRSKEIKTTSQIIEEQLLSPKSEIETDITDSQFEIKPYRKFNPPFPDSKQTTDTPKTSRHIAAYIENVESTDTSTIGNTNPKITSPTDVSLVSDPKMKIVPYKSPNIQDQREQREREQRERDQRERDQRERDQREQREREQRERDQREQREQREREQREREQREREQKEKEKREREQKEKEKEQEMKEKPLTYEELVSRAQDCYLKYQILQKSWQEYKFPNMDEKLVQSKPQMVIDTYNKSVERIQIDMDVNQYKIALIIMFLVIEVVCVKFLGFDAGGYTLSQIKAMNRYEKLLIEIGERKMLIGGDSWPPEVRILFIGLFNCGLFILMKYLSSVLGPELVGYISPIVNGLFSGALDNSKTANLPDELPQKQQDISGMLGGVASMAAKALSGNQPVSNNIPASRAPRASRRPVYRE